MARRVKKQGSTPLLPEAFTNFVARNMVRLAGIFLWILFLAIVLALVSYDSMDATINTANDAPVQNWLLVPGAYLADILLQTLGLGSFFLALPLIGWG